MWGTRTCTARVPSAYGIIPTHVGNTSPRASSPTTRWDHPHACGEHPKISLARLWNSGSSPRMWGTLLDLSAARPPIGIIPTHVGNTRRSWKPTMAGRDHPHACGEHTPSAKTLTSLPGSSPRMWGTRNNRRHRGIAEGIIPTHVGNTEHKAVVVDDAGDHPHACGEHGMTDNGAKKLRGSSPRMWGTPSKLRLDIHRQGIIPTHVGNTAALRHQAGNGRDHPHACGEHKARTIPKWGETGSSPRMWGTHRSRVDAGGHVGIIPTHVGNTSTNCEIGMRYRDHPHACGEHSSKAFISRSGLGSSPRMWGTH